MEHSLLFTTGRHNKIPLPLILSILFLLTAPFLALKLGVYIPSNANLMPTILQVLSMSLGLMAALLSFIQYKICKDNLSLLLGSTLLFSAVLAGFNLLLTCILPLSAFEQAQLNALFWTYSNALSSCVLLAGLLLLLNTKLNPPLLMVSLIFLALAFLSVTYKLPLLWQFKMHPTTLDTFITPALYLFIVLFIYAKLRVYYPSVLSECIFYMSVTQIVTYCYLLASHSAAFLNLLFYCIPLSCLLLDYVLFYSNTINAQKRLKLQQKELKYLASHDSLTNLYNRREFEDLLDKSIANASRTTGTLALLLMNIDNFTTINDTYGPIHGNELLKQFARRLNALIRKGDILSRVEGDEFTIILPNPKSPRSARQMAQRILNEIHSPYPLGDKLITMTASIGISLYPQDGNTTEDLLRKADLALCKAKRLGKNTYQFYIERLSDAQHRESEIESYFRKALQEDEFQLYYQPQYELSTQAIIGAEVLLRWNNQVLGLIPPEEFIPIAESTGLIIDLGQWVLRKAVEQILSWRQRYPNQLKFAINISPTELQSPLFLNAFNKMIQYYATTPEFLEFEITEDALITQNEELIQALHHISNLGIKIALDDFGKAYSSLSRLKNLPIDALKIDKIFISDIKEEQDKVFIVDLILKLAEELGLKVIAEGIETSQQLKYLTEKKCAIGQGRFLSEPLNAGDFAAFVFKNYVETE